MANTKISALTANTNPNGNEEFVYAYNNANGKITLDTVKSFIWWAGVTTLNADANIWELNEWTYVTTYDLYYKSWEVVDHMSAWWAEAYKQMIFVVKESTGERGYFVFNEWHSWGSSLARAGYWISNSSSVGYYNKLWDRDYPFTQYWPVNETSTLGALEDYGITRVVSWIQSTQTLSISGYYPPRPWLTYTIYIDSVASWQDYSIVVWTWVTNPFNITLPTNSTKKCVITVLITSTTTGIVTWCTIEN